MNRKGPLQEAELTVGRRAQDGKVFLSAALPGLLTLSVQDGAERASTVMLTPEQVGELRRALANIERLIREEARAGAWDGGERRKAAA